MKTDKLSKATKVVPATKMNKSGKVGKDAKAGKGAKAGKEAKVGKSAKAGKDVTASLDVKATVASKADQLPKAASVSTEVKVNKVTKPGKPSKGAKMDKRVTNREFKLLLKPEGLDRRSQISQLSSLIVVFCKKFGVDFFHIDNANTGLRNVYFYDTPGEDFRHANLILRVRESRQNVWVDDWCEVTMKCRAHDFKESLTFDPSPASPHKARMRIKEEILRGDELGSIRLIYSNNAILDTVPVDSIFDRSFDSVTNFFPDLKRLELDPNIPIRIVGGRVNKVLEACLPLGNISFGDGVQAHCDIGIWMRSVGDPIIGELAFSYRVTDENRGNLAAHKKADKFFKQLQLAIPSWLATGSTKTALIYGKPE